MRGFFSFFFFFVCLLLLFTESIYAIKPSHYSVPFNRTLFPSSFLFGAGSAAYQSEGAAYIDGKGPSIWDTFTKQHAEKIADHSNGDVADDFYHRYKSDIHLMKKIGLDSFRFSISWSRIFPEGKGKVNELGVKFYNNLIDELISNGLIPFVTLFHWDFPQALEDKYGGFRSRQVVNDFGEYVDFCFKTFGDRVKYWATLNEPYIFTTNAYNTGKFAPGRCSNYVGNCTSGNSAVEPYLVGHHLLLSHAAAVKLYKTKYQASQKGQIGITLVTNWFIPKSTNVADRQAAKRALDFEFGWYADPIVYGNYPKIMKSVVGDRLPKFTKAESEILKGSYDFIGLNYYTTNYAQNAPSNSLNKSYTFDVQVSSSNTRNGVSLGIPTEVDWLYIYPRGIHDLLLYIKQNYQNPPIYITENGVGEIDNGTKPVNEAIKDGIRIRYLDGHLKSVLQAIKEGVNVKSYFVWSFLDDFEWNSGYTARFGLTYVDYKNNLARHLKYSAFWFKSFLLR